MNRLVVLFILAVTAASYATESLVVTQRGGPRSWNAYLGPERITETRMFALAGDDGLAKAADLYTTGRSASRIAGPALIAAGALLAIAPRNENDNVQATMPFVVMGAGAAAFGLKRLWSGWLTAKRSATYEQAQAAAESYNAAHSTK